MIVYSKKEEREREREKNKKKQSKNYKENSRITTILSASFQFSILFLQILISGDERREVVRFMIVVRPLGLLFEQQNEQLSCGGGGEGGGRDMGKPPPFFFLPPEGNFHRASQTRNTKEERERERVRLTSFTQHQHSNAENNGARVY